MVLNSKFETCQIGPKKPVRFIRKLILNRPRDGLTGGEANLA